MYHVFLMYQLLTLHDVVTLSASWWPIALRRKLKIVQCDVYLRSMSG